MKKTVRPTLAEKKKRSDFIRKKGVAMGIIKEVYKR